MDATRSPGWYPAPDGNGQQWWNGAGWSESRQGGAPRVGAATPTMMQPSQSMAAPTAVGPTAAATTAPRVVYSATNPAPQYPGQNPAGGSQVRAAMQIDARANPSALYALIAGIVAVVFNALLIPSILAIVFGARGLQRAKELAAAGQPNTMRGLAAAGLALGIFGGVVGLIQALFFIISIVGGIFSSSVGVMS